MGALDSPWLAPLLEEHRRRRERLGREPDEPALRRVAAWYRPPGWATGFISPEDALFLYDFVRCIAPERMVEIGTASGASTAVLLMAMDDIARDTGARPRFPQVHSYDMLPTCFFDPARPVGSAVHEMAPELLDGLALHIRKGAAEVAQDFAQLPLPLVFLDANHHHPWPIGDVLTLSTALSPGAWVVIHDINLPQLGREHELRTGTTVGWDQTGVQRLFDAWPFDKVAGGGRQANIGALHVPDPSKLTAAVFREALDFPWEAQVNKATANLLGVR